MSTCLNVKIKMYRVFTSSNKNVNVDFKRVFLWQMGEWKTVRLTAALMTAKLNEQITVELKARKSEKSDVLIQRIAGCNGKGVHFNFNINTQNG